MSTICRLPCFISRLTSTSSTTAASSPPQPPPHHLHLPSSFPYPPSQLPKSPPDSHLPTLTPSTTDSTACFLWPFTLPNTPNPPSLHAPQPHLDSTPPPPLKPRIGDSDVEERASRRRWSISDLEERAAEESGGLETWKKKMQCLVKYLFECFPTFLNNNNNNNNNNNSCLKDDGRDEEEDSNNIDTNTNIIVSSANAQTIIATPVAPAPARAVQTWRCYLCNVKVAHEETLNAHLRGKHHRKKLRNQLWMMMEEESSVGSVLELEGTSQHVITTVKRTCDGGWMCLLCYASCYYNANLVDHLIGKKHANARMHAHLASLVTT
ncbi:hypothetical protein LINPERHAP2_LOCUS39734 [Linum perenne]